MPEKRNPMEIKIEKLSDEEKEERGVYAWPVWEKEVSRFPWHYDATEECYILEGRVAVETGPGQRVEFGPGDFVTFPLGLDCVWDVREPVRKHYNFR
jgi:uncharacterized cupin superfamily protein